MDRESTVDLEEFEAAIGHPFTDVSLLARALTHSSCKNDVDYSNERLEFLGDAVLGMIVSEYLFRTFPERTEGQLTRVKSVVVSRATLAKAARRIGLGEFLIIGKGLRERRTVPASLLANAFEAVLAAIYVDAGMEAARGFVLRCLSEHVERVLLHRHEPNYKSVLQQYAQREMSVTPAYALTAESGPDHGKSFTMVTLLGGRRFGAGTGSTKKEAEQMAAAETLRALRVDPSTGVRIPNHGTKDGQGST